MSVLANAVDQVTPIMRLDYRHERVGRSIVHELVDNANPSVNLKPAGPRGGTMELLVDDLDVAIAADAILAAGLPCSWTDSDLPALSMGTFTLVDRIRLELDPETRLRYVVIFGFLEVLP